MMLQTFDVPEALPAADSSRKADAGCGTASFFPVAAGSEWKAAFLEAQVDATPDGMLVVDSEGKILLRNKRFNALFKVPPEIGGDGEDSKLLEHVTGKTKDPSRFLERIRYLYAHPGQTDQDEIELVDGTVLDRYSAPVLGRAGEYYGRIWTFRDITERKQLEAQFLRAQRLESVGALASGVAHDLNNILAPVLMAAPLLREGAPDSDFRALAEMVEKCARRGADIIKQLLTFARGAPGSRVPVPVRHLLRDIQKIIQETFPREIRPLLDADANLRFVMADATQLHQALLNLCVNARDAMPNGGALTLRADNVDLDEKAAALIPEARPGPYVRIAVVDTGTGIPPENLGRIFEPFFTTKELGKGTGLGLSTVMGIVRGHGGFVRVESREGRGTTFELHLPASPEAAIKSAAITDTPVPRGNDELILLVDDEPAVRDSVRRMLQKNGYQVITASNGREGMAAYAQHRNDVQAVLTDMMMPAMNGPALVRSLRALDGQLPIFGMTGLAEPKANNGIEDLHLEAMLLKPFPGSELLRALRTTFQQQSDGDTPSESSDAEPLPRRLPC